jgi:NAD(P)-dependent dehydrogenase (short-subunit alcohol dehydrogenase family)
MVTHRIFCKRKTVLDLKGKIAFVSGAGSVGEGWGNGKATSVLFARQGAKVYGTDINPAAAEETRSIIEKEGGACAVRRCDMTDSADVAAAVTDCVGRYGRIDILVNNVGGSAPGDPVRMTEEAWDAQIDLNLKTAFLCCKHVLPVMAKQKSGAIVNIASVAGFSHQVGGRVHVAGDLVDVGLPEEVVARGDHRRVVGPRRLREAGGERERCQYPFSHDSP